MDPVRVFSPSLVFMGEVDDYNSLIYTRKWSTCGEFQITISKMNPLLAEGNIIILGTDPRKNGIIKYVQCSEQDGYITIKGYSLLWLLSGRVTVPPAGSSHFTVTGSVEDIMLALVSKNAVNPMDNKRKIPLLTCATSQGRGSTVTWQSRYAGLLSDLNELAQVSGLGIGIEIDYDAPGMVFKVYQGTDRAASQSAVPPALFSPGFDNLHQRVYTYNATESRNTAYVAGQGEGADRSVAIVGNENIGMDRMEVFVDARDIEDASELPERGEAKLASMQPVSSYTSSVIPRGYGTDWDLGDIVTIQDREYGLQLDRRVDEVEESCDASRDLVTPTFGAPEKTVADKLAETSGGGAGGESGLKFVPGRVLVSNSNGFMEASAVMTKELECLDEVAYNVQSQIGNLIELQTHEKGSLVGAANELNRKIDFKGKHLWSGSLTNEQIVNIDITQYTVYGIVIDGCFLLGYKLKDIDFDTNGRYIIRGGGTIVVNENDNDVGLITFMIHSYTSNIYCAFASMYLPRDISQKHPRSITDIYGIF